MSTGTITTLFWEAWSPEFARSVEMFTGVPVTLEPPKPVGAESSSLLWQGQVFERSGTGTLWIGTPMEAIGVLVQDTADEEGRIAGYREILCQSFAGAAHVLSGNVPPRLVCGKAIEDQSKPQGSIHRASTVLITADGQRFPLVLAYDDAFASLLSAAEEPSDVPEKVDAHAQHMSGILERFVDLEVPLAVVVGRAKVLIRDALKLTAGSLVELDRSTNDPVEIVVHNAVVARGEVVAVDGSYGVRITEIVGRRDGATLPAQLSSSSRSAVRPSGR